MLTTGSKSPPHIAIHSRSRFSLVTRPTALDGRRPATRCSAIAGMTGAMSSSYSGIGGDTVKGGGGEGSKTNGGGCIGRWRWRRSLCWAAAAVSLSLHIVNFLHLQPTLGAPRHVQTAPLSNQRQIKKGIITHNLCENGSGAMGTWSGASGGSLLFPRFLLNSSAGSGRVLPSSRQR